MNKSENITPFPEQDREGEKEKKWIDDTFDCEICSDRPGGCAQCGWGRNQEKNTKAL